MTYTVYYKKPGGFFWHKVKNVKGDTIIESDKGHALPVRVLFLSDETRLEIPMTCLIKYSPERFYDIQASMEGESGQAIRTKKGNRTRH